MDNFDEKQLEAKLRDTFMIARKNCQKKATNFLDPGQQQLAEQVAREFQGMQYYFDGGYEEAERKIMVAYPEFLEDEHFKQPFGALRVTPRDADSHLGHRDYLGAVLGLGINREVMGDILVAKSYADIIVKEEMVEYIGLNLLKVGNTSVDIEEISLKELMRPERPYKELKSTVASLRIDAIASIAFGLSRSKMAPIIKGENLKLNFKIIKDPATPVNEGDIISASHLGRAKVVEVGGQSKKGRTFVKIHRYTSR
jgi:RNA-binding protein YlmH